MAGIVNTSGAPCSVPQASAPLSRLWCASSLRLSRRLSNASLSLEVSSETSTRAGPLLDRRRAPRKTITSLRASKPGANYSRNKHKHRLACTHRHTCGHFHSSQRGETSSHALVLRVAFAVRRDESRPGDWDVEDTRMGERASRQAHTRVRDTLCAACACQTH